MTLRDTRIAKYERHYNLSYELWKVKSVFVYNVKNAIGLQEHDNCKDCGVDFNHPVLGECTEECMCEEMDCRFNHVTSGNKCDCDYCTDYQLDYEERDD